MQGTFDQQMPVATGCCSKDIKDLNGYCNILSTRAIELQAAISASKKSAEQDSLVQTVALTKTYSDLHKLIVKKTFAQAHLAIDSPPIFLKHQRFLF